MLISWKEGRRMGQKQKKERIDGATRPGRIIREQIESGIK